MLQLPDSRDLIDEMLVLASGAGLDHGLHERCDPQRRRRHRRFRRLEGEDRILVVEAANHPDGAMRGDSGIEHDAPLGVVWGVHRETPTAMRTASATFMVGWVSVA